MPKYLIQSSYTTEGIHGLAGDSASGRRADVQAAVQAVGGKVEAFYYAFGADDTIIILDLPDNVTAAVVRMADDLPPPERLSLGDRLARMIGRREE